jgi:nucleoside-diphosphate-sugar epimerase
MKRESSILVTGASGMIGSAVCRNLAEQRSVVKTFPSTLQANGGSLNTQDRSGRYFTVRYLNTNGVSTNKVWDSQTDTI